MMFVLVYEGAEPGTFAEIAAGHSFPIYAGSKWRIDGGEVFDPQRRMMVEQRPDPAVYVPNILSIGVFLNSIKSLELAKLRSSKDVLVQQFVFLCTDPRITEIDTNDPRIQFDLNYAAGLVPAPAGAPNPGAIIEEACIGLDADGAARVAAILAGNTLAAAT